MCLLPTKPRKQNSKTKTVPKKPKRPQQSRIVGPFQPHPSNPTSHIPYQVYNYTPPPPPAPVKNPKFYFSKPKKDRKVDVKRRNNKNHQDARIDPNMSNGLAPWV